MDATVSPRWQLRFLGGAAGALTSLALGLAGGAVALVSGLIDASVPGSVALAVGVAGIGGVPIGGILGMIFGPRIVERSGTADVVVRAAFIGGLVGPVELALLGALAEAHAATPLEVVVLAGFFALVTVPLGAIVGIPSALAVAFLAVGALRLSVDRRRALWLPALLVLVVVGASTWEIASVAVDRGGDAAARNGDEVPFQYVVVNQSNTDYMLATRSYWDGEIGAGSGDGYLGRGCSSGDDHLQGSEWGIWLVEANADWVDRPSGTPIASSQTFGTHRPVRVTITIAPDSKVAVREGVSATLCP